MEFKTFGGRVVFDGGGVDPDFSVPDKEFAAISRSLSNNHLLFHYATEYFYSRDDIGDPRKFKLTDTEYNQFVSWLNDKDYSYQTKMEKEIGHLMDNLKEEQNNDQVIASLKDANNQIKILKEKDLMNHKSEIKQLLEQDIASRYYLERGIIEVSFQNDQDVQAALQLFKNPQDYSKLLKVQ